MTQIEWKPTPRQSLLMECALNAGLNRNVTAICAEAKVSTVTFYRWRKEPGFRHAWDNLWSEAIARHLPGVVAAMVQEAQSGNPQAARLIMQAGGTLNQTVTVKSWQDELIELVKAGKVTPESVRDELGDDVARQIIMAAGVVEDSAP